MPPISLTLQQLSRWLTKRGVELKEPLWHMLRSGCNEHLVFEYQLVIDQVPWKGAARLSVSFVQCSKVRSAGWSISGSLDQLCSDDEILVIGLVLEAMISCPHRLRCLPGWLTPHISQPDYGVRIEYPSLEDLETAWEALSSLAPQVYAALEMLGSIFEQEINKRAVSNTDDAMIPLLM